MSFYDGFLDELRVPLLQRTSQETWRIWGRVASRSGVRAAREEQVETYGDRVARWKAMIKSMHGIILTALAALVLLSVEKDSAAAGWGILKKLKLLFVPPFMLMAAFYNICLAFSAGGSARWGPSEDAFAVVIGTIAITIGVFYIYPFKYVLMTFIFFALSLCVTFVVRYPRRMKKEKLED